MIRKISAIIGAAMFAVVAVASPAFAAAQEGHGTHVVVPMDHFLCC